MPDLVKKWKEQHPYLTQLEDELNEENERKQKENQRRQEEYERQYSQYQAQQNRDIANSIKLSSPLEMENRAQQERVETMNAGPYKLTPEAEARRQSAAAGDNALTPYMVAMQATMAKAPTAPQQEETRSNAQLRNEARTLDAARRIAGMESNRQGLLLSQDPTKMYDRQFTTGLRDLGNTANELKSQADTAWKYADAIAAQRAATEAWKTYSHYRDNPDFIENSKPDPKVENRIYYSMAHPEEAIEENGAAVNAAAYADDEDKAMYFYLWNTQGSKAANTFYNDYVKNKASAAKAADVQMKATVQGYEKPFASSVKSLGSNLISGVGLVDMFFQNIARDYGITNPNRALNYNSLAMMPSLVTDSMREGVMKKIGGQKVDDETVDAAAWTAAWMYQLGMSMADSTVGMALNLIGVPQAATLALMGGAAGTRAIREARNRGATDGEALAFGFASAIAEAAFEKLSLDVGIDNVMKQFNGTKTTGRALMDLIGVKDRFGLASWLTTQLITGVVEGSEEGFTTIANTLADRIIMGDNSQFELQRQALLEQGVSEEEATKAALKSWLADLGGDVLGGFISGGVMGGVQQLGGLAAGAVNGAVQTAADVQSGLIRTDLQNWVNANQQEQRLRQQYEQQNAPQQQQTKLTIPSQETVSARQADPLGYAMNKATSGETVTKQDARAIIENPQALQALRDSGVLTGKVANDSEGRGKVVDAVNALAENQRQTAEIPAATENNSQEAAQIPQETAQAAPLPTQENAQQEERVSTPPVPRAQESASEAPTEGKLKIPEQKNTPPVPRSGLTVRSVNDTLNENRQEATNGQAETAASSEAERARKESADFREAANKAAGSKVLDRAEWNAGLGRLLQAVRNARDSRNYEQRRSEAARITNQAEAGNPDRLSAKDLGLANGSDEKLAVEVAAKILGPDAEEAVARLAKQGVTLRFISGQMRLNKLDSNGKPVQVRAYVSEDRKNIIVQADNPRVTWQQLLAHEELHKLIKENAEYRKSVMDALLADKKVAPYLSQIIDRYADAYHTVDPKTTDEEIIEELLADYRAGFDMLDPLGTNRTLSKVTKAAAKDIRAVEQEAKVGIEVDAKSESANPGSYSIETWNASDYVQNRAAAAADLAEQLGVSNRQALKYINDINSIAKIIANDRVRLDYTPSPGRSSFIGNTEYGGSIDFSTICKKRRLYTGTLEAIQKALPNTALTADEVLEIRSMMKERGYEVSCGLCYVEGSRVKLGEYTQQFLDSLKDTGMYVPTMAEMNTSDGQETLRAEHPEVYDEYVKFMNKLAQRKPKLFQMATEYQGEILKKFKNDGTVDQKNRNGGLRLQSFSDFEIIHLIDTMQVIMDMSRVGLAGQAYTKVPDFAWALGDTGLKINLSLIAKGVDADGHIILDEVEGMKRSDAEELRNAYSKNVGTILVTFNDEQLKAAMADPFIDFIIPFHRSQWSKSQYEAIGLPSNSKDYTDQQNESYIEKVYNANGKPQRPANYMPNNYWDFSKTGKENAEAYLRMCAENNRKPKFYKLLEDNGDGSYSLQKDGSTDGYWKLLSDYKMYDNAGKGSPQTPVKPKFNMEQAERMLNDYTGGHQSFPVAQDVVDDFLKGKQGGKASTEIGYEEGEYYGFREKAQAGNRGSGTADDAQFPGVVEQTPSGTRADGKENEGNIEENDREWADRLKKSAYQPKEGTVEYELSRTAKEQYGMDTVITPKTVWDAERGANSPCMFCLDGVIYSRDGLTEDQKNIGVPHEATHAMKQENYTPYLSLLNEFPVHFTLFSDAGSAFFAAAMEHRHLSADKVIEYPGDSEEKKAEKAKARKNVFDEILATLYGHVVNGQVTGDTDFYADFDFREVVDDLSEVFDRMKAIHRGFETWNKERQNGKASIEIDPDVAAQFSPEAIALREQARGRRTNPNSKRKVSKVRSNTYDASGLFNEVEAQMDEADESNYEYDPISEKRSMNEARSRLKDFDNEVAKLSQPDYDWGGSDLDTAMGILYNYRQNGRATGDYTDFWNWSKVIQQKGTKGGQFVQAFAKYSRTGTGTAAKAAATIHEQNRLTPAQQKLVTGHVERLMNGVKGDTQGAADDAMKQAKGKKEPTRKQDGKADKKKLDAETRRRKDAERLVREIYNLFERQQNHGEPVEDWLKLTGEELAKKIATRFNESTPRQKTTMQIILGDLVGFAEEHALPTKPKGETERRTAIGTITDYLNNRDAYNTAWAEAQDVLRAQYADDQEKLDALDGFLSATIAYNGEGTDRTMLDAILQSADVLGISEKRILELASAGATNSTIDRIGDELVSQVKERMGADWQDGYAQQLKDAVRRHVTGIALSESASEQALRLGRLETDAARKLDIDLQKILTESRLTKQDASRRVADYLIRELGIPSADAAIAAQRISESFMDELAGRADKRLGQMFGEKTTKAKEQRDKLLDLLRLGGFTNANVEDAVVDALGIGKLSREEQRRITGDMARFGETLDAIMDDDLEGLRQLIREQAAVRGTKLSRLSEKVLSGETDVEYLRDFAMAQLASIAGDYAPRSAGEKISTYQTISHLLNMRTALRNVTSNQVFDLIDSAANNMSMLPDALLGIMTGKRTVGLNKSWASQQKRQGAVKGAGRNLLEVNLDVGVDDRQKSKYGTAGRRTWNLANSNTAGKIMSHLEEVMGYELNTTDEFHKGSVMGETLESLARFVDRGDMTLEEAQDFATEMALYRSFQDDSMIGTMLSAIKEALNIAGVGEQNGKKVKGKNVHDFGLGDFLTKYTQVPGALVHRAIEFSPLGYVKAAFNLGQLVNQNRKGENTNAAQRKAALALGRATTGSGLIALFAALAAKGLLRRDDKEDKNAKAAHQAQGLSGTQLNLTALGRWIGGDSTEPQDGDILMDINFLEPLDALMALGAMVAESDDLSLNSIKDMSVNAIWESISSLSMMQTLRGVAQVRQYYNEDDKEQRPLPNQIAWEIAASSVSGFIPSVVRQLAQATDTTYREQYGSKDVNEQIRAKVMNSVPGLRQKLNPKITPLGEEKQYEKPLLNALNATMNPGNVSVYKSSDVVDELNRVYDETNDAEIWPERNAPYTITYGDEKYTLTTDERTLFQRDRGQLTERMMAETKESEWYQKMDAEAQADILNWIGNFANAVATASFVEGRGKDYYSSTYSDQIAELRNGAPLADIVKSKNSKAAEYADIGLSSKEVEALKKQYSAISNQSISSYEKGVKQRALINSLDYSDDDKLRIYASLANADSRIEKFRTVMDEGLSFSEIVNVYDKYSELDNQEGLKAGDKAKEFALWVDKQKYTAGQKETIKDQFNYWQMMSANTDRYDKLKDLGLDPDTASAIDKAIGALEPLPGKESVSNSQKWNAALKALGSNASKQKKLDVASMFFDTSMTTDSGKPSQWAKIKRVADSGVSVEDTLKMVENEKLDVYVKWMDSDAKTAGVKSDTYISWREKYNGTSSTRDENGKEVKGQTKKDKILAYIDSLNLTTEQKDALFLEEYKESGLKDTPWHKSGGGKSSGSYAPARIPTLRVPEIPKAEKPRSGLRITAR